MRQRRLGVSGPAVSVVGLGCNNFGMKLDERESRRVVDAAIDAGITHFDTAAMYGAGRSEEFLGAALGSRREEVVVATKFLPRPSDDAYTPGALARRIRAGCEASLRRLGTDHIDLYYQHYPDPDAPIDEVLTALHNLVHAGKVRHAGASNMSGAALASAARTAEGRGLVSFCAAQIEWNLLSRDVEAEVVPAALAAGAGIVPYFPLASGMLTGKYQRAAAFPEGSRLATMQYFTSVATDQNFDRVEALRAFAGELGHTLLELAIAWLAAQPGVGSVIAGATTPEQVRANAAAAAWELDAAELAGVPA